MPIELYDQMSFRSPKTSLIRRRPPPIDKLLYRAPVGHLLLSEDHNPDTLHPMRYTDGRADLVRGQERSAGKDGMSVNTQIPGRDSVG